MSGNDNYGYGYGYDYNYQSTSPTQPLNNQYYGYGSNQQHQQPQQQPQQQQYQQSNNYGQQPQQPSFNEFLNNPAAQIGVQFGAQALSAGQKYINTNVKITSKESLNLLFVFLTHVCTFVA